MRTARILISVGRGGAAGSAACACTRARHARADVNVRAARTKPRWRGAGAEHPHAPARALPDNSCSHPADGGRQALGNGRIVCSGGMVVTRTGGGTPFTLHPYNPVPEPVMNYRL